MTTLKEFKEITKDWSREPVKVESPIGDMYMLNGNESFESPKILIDGLLVEESITILSGEPKSGKGWLALYVCKQLIENRNMKVLYLDRENGKSRISRRIRAIRDYAEEWNERFYFVPNPKMDQTDEAKENFRQFLDKYEPDLIIFDSFAGFLAAMGLDENKSGDIASWSEAYLRPIRVRGITALIIDHTPRGEGRSRGSMRKSEEADVNLYLDPEGKFDKETTTTVVVKRLSDRDGELPPESAFTIGGDGSGRFIFEESETHRLGLSGKKLQLFSVLEKHGENGLTHSEWLEKAKSEGMNVNTARSNISQLKDHLYEGNPIIRQEDKKYYSKVIDWDALGNRGTSVSGKDDTN